MYKSSARSGQLQSRSGKAAARPKRRRFIPMTPSGSVLAHLEAGNEQQAWQNLLEDASHMPYRTVEDFKTRGYTVTELEDVQ